LVVVVVVDQARVAVAAPEVFYKALCLLRHKIIQSSLVILALAPMLLSLGLTAHLEAILPYLI